MFEAGQTPPLVFFDRPILPPHLHDYWMAFCDLTTERQIGMGLGPIPASKIRAYAIDELELLGDERDRFFAVMRRTDDGYLAMNAPAKPQTAAMPTKEVPIQDGEGVRKLFAGMAERKRAKK